jgi:pimeloyl-ACP methyl ester carboxylesterase
MLVEYRGYGKSEGTPTEKGLVLDAQAAIDHLAARVDIDSKTIILFGRSLGGAVALALCNKRREKVAGVMVENTFLNISEMVDAVFPFLRVVKNYVLTINWPSHENVTSITSPILFLAGENDELVPPVQMKQVHVRATVHALRGTRATVHIIRVAILACRLDVGYGGFTWQSLILGGGGCQHFRLSTTHLCCGCLIHVHIHSVLSSSMIWRTDQ